MIIYTHIFQSDDICQSRVNADEADGAGSTAVGLLKIRLRAVCELHQAIMDLTDESFYYSAKWSLLAFALESRNSISRMAGSFEISRLDIHTHTHTHTHTYTHTHKHTYTHTHTRVQEKFIFVRSGPKKDRTR